MLLLCQVRHEVVLTLSDFHCLRQAGREESSLHLYASFTSLEIMRNEINVSGGPYGESYTAVCL